MASNMDQRVSDLERRVDLLESALLAKGGVISAPEPVAPVEVKVEAPAAEVSAEQPAAEPSADAAEAA